MALSSLVKKPCHVGNVPVKMHHFPHCFNSPLERLTAVKLSTSGLLASNLLSKLPGTANPN